MCDDDDDDDNIFLFLFYLDNKAHFTTRLIFDFLIQ